MAGFPETPPRYITPRVHNPWKEKVIYYESISYLMSDEVSNIERARGRAYILMDYGTYAAFEKATGLKKGVDF